MTGRPLLEPSAVAPDIWPLAGATSAVALADFSDTTRNLY
jgi:hypothetical protein